MRVPETLTKIEDPAFKKKGTVITSLGIAG
jgi:hypothetical protein